jgi:hypothetical protein
MVRARVVAHLAAHPEQYAPYVPQPYPQYIQSMARPGTWGDHVTLKAAGGLTHGAPAAAGPGAAGSSHARAGQGSGGPLRGARRQTEGVVDVCAEARLVRPRAAPRPPADAWGIKIFVVTSFLENSVLSIDPARESPAFARRALHLSFWAEVRAGGRARSRARRAGAGGAVRQDGHICGEEVAGTMRRLRQRACLIWRGRRHCAPPRARPPAACLNGPCPSPRVPPSRPAPPRPAAPLSVPVSPALAPTKGRAATNPLPPPSAVPLQFCLPAGRRRRSALPVQIYPRRTALRAAKLRRCTGGCGAPRRRPCDLGAPALLGSKARAAHFSRSVVASAAPAAAIRGGVAPHVTPAVLLTPSRSAASCPAVSGGRRPLTGRPPAPAAAETRR